MRASQARADRQTRPCRGGGAQSVHTAECRARVTGAGPGCRAAASGLGWAESRAGKDAVGGSHRRPWPVRRHCEPPATQKPLLRAPTPGAPATLTAQNTSCHRPRGFPVTSVRSALQPTWDLSLPVQGTLLGEEASCTQLLSGRTKTALDPRPRVLSRPARDAAPAVPSDPAPSPQPPRGRGLRRWPSQYRFGGVGGEMDYTRK